MMHQPVLSGLSSLRRHSRVSRSVGQPAGDILHLSTVVEGFLVSDSENKRHELERPPGRLEQDNWI